MPELDLQRKSGQTEVKKYYSDELCLEKLFKHYKPLHGKEPSHLVNGRETSRGEEKGKVHSSEAK